MLAVIIVAFVGNKVPNDTKRKLRSIRSEPAKLPQKTIFSIVSNVAEISVLHGGATGDFADVVSILFATLCTD